MQKFIIIVAGGTGTRMQSSVPKQFIELNGKPILMHTIEKFYNTYNDIKVIVALADSLKEDWERLCKQYNFTIEHQIASGGETRFHSVKSGLELVPENAVVGIHDAARPLVSTETIQRTFEEAEKSGNASPSIPITESLREVSEGKNKSIDRDTITIVQTPQCFQSTVIKAAFAQPYQESFTDDASVLEADGETINLVAGNKENIKITSPEDLMIAKAFMQSN